MPEATGQLLKMLKENNYKPRIFYPLRAKGKKKNKKESKGKMFSDKRKRKELITKRPALQT